MGQDRKQRLSIEFIRSDACTWPPQVKVRAEEIIKLSAELAALRGKTAEINMVEYSKIELLNQVAMTHQKLSRAYTNMAKELVYHLAQPTLITEGNKQ